MKKTMILLLGALMASVLPGSGLKAQNTPVSVVVSTLDRAALTSAKIYAVSDADQYYHVDAAHLDASWSDPSTSIETIDAANVLDLAMEATANGTRVYQNVPASFATAFIVLRDANDVYYVYGTASPAERKAGVFKASSIFDAVAADSNVNYGHIVHATAANRAVIRDAYGNVYTSLVSADANSASGAELTFIDTVVIDAPVSIANSHTIRQRFDNLGTEFPVVSNVTGSVPAITIAGGATAVWYGRNEGEDAILAAAAAPLFGLNGGNLTVNKLNAAATGTEPLIVVTGNDTLRITSATVAGSATSPAITLNDGVAIVDDVTFAAGSYAVNLVRGYNGTLQVLASTVLGNMGATGGINADAYRTAGDYRIYKRTLTAVVDGAANGETVYVARNFSSSTTPDNNALITKPVVLDLGGYTISGNFYANNTEDTLVLRNGKIGTITDNADATGAIRIDDLDSVGVLNANSHPVEILNARIRNIFPPTGANVTIYGGKYNQDVTGYLAPRRVLVENADADAANFANLVVEGYKVTFRNHNARGIDTTIVYNTPDNRIVPAPSRPAYVGADTVFAHYWTDPAYTNPWLFDQSVLTSDTTLYAKWDIFDAATMNRLTVNFYVQNVARDGFELVDSLTCAVKKVGEAPFTTDTFIVIPTRRGFHTSNNRIAQISRDAGVDSIMYYRDTTIFHWNLNGGTFVEAGHSVDTVLAYGDTLRTALEIKKTGHNPGRWRSTMTIPGTGLNAWQYVSFPIAVPLASNGHTFDTIKFDASYTPKDSTHYPVIWSDNNDTIEFDYNGESRANDITATFYDDDNVQQNLTLTFSSANGSGVTPRTVGVYNIVASYPEDGNYRLGFKTKVLRISPYSVIADSVDEFRLVKKYDGTRSVEATVTRAYLQSPAPFGNDEVYARVDTLLYSDATAGFNKSIIAYVSVLYGADAMNYTLANDFFVASREGVIVPVPVVDDEETANDSIAQLYVGINGFCAGDGANVKYHILSGGDPDQYSLVFNPAAIAQGFENVEWASLDTPGEINIVVPDNAMRGVYSAELVLRNSNYVAYESTPGEFNSRPITIVFGVKLSKQYARPLFEDVIAIVDTDTNLNIDLNTIQWYRNGEAIPGATYPYYQEVGGFNDGDDYFVSFRLKGEDETLYTCPQDSLGADNYVKEDDAEATVSVYPNPTTDNVNVKVENPTQFTHAVRVMNVMGVTVYEGMFNGDNTTIDFSRFGNGSYTVSVDGIVVRVIKK